MKDWYRKRTGTVALLLLLAALFAERGWPEAQEQDDDPPQFSEWSTPVNLGPPISTAGTEVDPFLSRDGLSLYFSCNFCPGGFGGFDLYVSERASVNDPWGPPQNLGPTINSPMGESNPVLSYDEHQLFFTSVNRPGGFGGQDLYVTRRHNRRDSLGWQPPRNLGPEINTADREQMATYFEDPLTGVITLYFVSNRAGGPGLEDIYASTLQPDETFGSPVLVSELSSPASDLHPVIRRRDGLEMFVESNRPGSLLNLAGQPSFDIWVSTRCSTSDPWSEPLNLGPVVNSNFHDARVGLSWDATTMYLQTARPENVTPLIFDIWLSTRTKLQRTE